jgi:hypothetical protein
LFDLRRQDTKNRQNSIDDVDDFTKQELEITIKRHFDSAMDIYKHMLEMGIAKECARFVLPLAVPTRIYMSGSVRSWMHYIDLAFCSWNSERTHGYCYINVVKSLQNNFLFVLKHWSGTDGNISCNQY